MKPPSQSDPAYRGIGSQWLSTPERRDIRQEAKRRALRKVEEREHLRLELKAREYINNCHGIAETLVHGYEEHIGEHGGVERVELSRARVQALKTATDIFLRLLDRVLPPLKAVEQGSSPEEDLKDVATMSERELTWHLRRLNSIPGEYTVQEEDKEPFG